MSEFKSSNKNGIAVMVEKFQKRLFLAKKLSPSVPQDVKEGHFAVIAMDDFEERRFVVPVTCLKRPSFIRLLERAAEEYGFNHEGAVVIPCPPSDLEGMLAEQQAEEKMPSCKTLFPFNKYARNNV